MLSLSLACAACSYDDLSAPAIKHSTFIAGPGGVSMSVSETARVDGGGFVLVGRTSIGAWAGKIDPNGNVLWLYNRPLDSREKRIPSDSSRPILSPSVQYTGAAPMPDGSTFLCGSLTHKSVQIQPALLTHIGRNGEFLGDILLHPQGVDEPNLYTVANCIRWGSEIVVFAGSLEKGQSQFWIFAVDEQGKLKWEERFAPLAASQRPRWTGSARTSANVQDEQFGLMPWASTISLAVKADDSAIYFLTTDRNNSELDSIDRDGRLLARKALPGSTWLLSSVEPATQLSVYGFSSRLAATEAVQTYNNKLDLISESPVDLKATRSLKYILGGYVQRDRSLFLFGGSNDGFGLAVSTGVSHVGPDLRSERHLSLKAPGAALGIPATFATPTPNTGEYLVATPVVRPSGLPHSPGDPDSVTPGLELFFIDTK